MKLSLFFTFGISAALWSEQGLLDREKLLYEKMISRGDVDKVYWFTYGTDDRRLQENLIDGIEIVPMPSIFRAKIGRLFYSLMLPIIHFNKLKTVDILKTNQMSGSWSAAISKILYRKKLVTRTGYTWSLFASKDNPGRTTRALVSLIEKTAYSLSDGIILSSQNDLTHITNRYHPRGTKIVIPNYIDTDLFKPLGVPKIENSICFVGRLNEQKNLPALLEALAGLPHKLTVVGEGEMREGLERLARSKGVRAAFLGNVPNSSLPEILNENEIFILPSFYEGMPKALLEAMSCGLPCIGSNVDGIREVIEHKINGFLCDTDTVSIRKAVLEIWANRELRAKISRNARETIVNYFTLEKCLRKELALYKSL